MLAFLLIAALFVLSAMALRVFLPSIDLHVTALGREFHLGRPLVALIFTVLTIGFAIVAEIALFGYSRSFLHRQKVTKSNSAHLDLIAFILVQIKLMSVLSLAFSLGSVWLANSMVTKHLGGVQIYPRLAEISPLLAVFAFVVVFTYFDYWNHRILHSKLFWPLHRFHHSASELNLITSYRNHPGQDLLSPLTRTLPMVICGVPEVVAFYFFLANGFYQLIVHVNSDFRWGGFGKYVLLSPMHHKIHHSCNTSHLDKNYGIVAVWDRIHGTYFDDSLTDPIELGVKDADYTKERNLLRIFWRDFGDFLRRWRKAEIDAKI